jgi:hypothetical protein
MEKIQTRCYRCERPIMEYYKKNPLCFNCKKAIKNIPKVNFVGDEINNNKNINFIEDEINNNKNINFIGDEINNKNISSKITTLNKDIKPTLISKSINRSEHNNGYSSSYLTMTNELENLYLPITTKRTLSESVIPNTLDLEWKTPIAIQRANEFLMLGYKPSSLDKREGGHATWTNFENWEEIVIKDKPRLHFDPIPHVDVMYGTAKIFVPADKRDGVRFISQTAIYDELNGTLTAGCHFIGAVIATLALVKLYAEGHYTKKRSQSEYGRTIKRIAKELADFESEFESEFKKLGYFNDGSYREKKLMEETAILEKYVTGYSILSGNIDSEKFRHMVK